MRSRPCRQARSFAASSCEPRSAAGAAIPSATIHVVEGDHYVAGRHPDAFVEARVERCQLVARRVGANRERRAVRPWDAAAPQ